MQQNNSKKAHYFFLNFTFEVGDDKQEKSWFFSSYVFFFFTDLRNESYIFSVDRGINQKSTENCINARIVMLCKIENNCLRMCISAIIKYAMFLLMFNISLFIQLKFNQSIELITQFCVCASSRFDIYFIVNLYIYLPENYISEPLSINHNLPRRIKRSTAILLGGSS